MNEFEFWPDRTTDYGISCPCASKKYPYRPYNGENGVSTFSLLFLIGSFWYFHVTRTSIKAWMSLNFLKWDLTLAHKTEVSDRCPLGYLFFFSAFEPREKLNQSQMSFDNLMGYINVYAKFHHNIPLSSRDSAFINFSEFGARQRLDWWKNVISKSLGLDLVNINVYATVYQYIPLCLRDRAIFTFSEFGAQPMINVILQFLELDLVNINVSAKFYKNIPNGLRVKFHCFQNLNLGKTSSNPKCHLTISWATSCQYQCVCKISSQYSTQFKR